MDAQSKQKNDINDLIDRDIIDILGLSHLEESKKQELRNKILETVQNRVFNRVVDELSKLGKVEEFDKLSDDTTIEKFFADNGIDHEQIFLEEAMYYKTQLAAAGKIADIGLANQGKK